MSTRSTRELADLDRMHVWHPFTQHAVWDRAEPLVIERAEGCWLIDADGNRYLDGVSSLWTNVHGHGHPKIDQAIRDQLARVAHTTFLGLTHRPAIELAAELVHRAPQGLSRVFYSDSGSTSVEVAVKMAFQARQQQGETQRTRFATLRDAYHGDTLGAVSIGSIDLFHQVYKPLLFEPIVLPAPRAAGGPEEARALAEGLSLIEHHGPTLAAFVFEPLVQGAAGMKMHSPAFIRTLATAARKAGALLVADEVAVGFGRTGTLFAMEQVGIAPDLLCLAKGLSGGTLPLAATLTTGDVFAAFLGAPEQYRQFFHGHTFTANPLACAAALASLALFDDEAVLEHAGHLNALLARRLPALLRIPGVRAIRHKGVLVGIDLAPTEGSFAPSRQVGARVAMAARPRGAILRPLGDTLVLNPPLAISEPELDQLLDITEASMRAILAEEGL